MTTLFISDVHLTKDKPLLAQKLREFLKQQAINAEALYILGDFFEVWIGDEYDKYNQSIIDSLKQLQATGTVVYFMVGNRDFLIGKSFAKVSGCQLIADPTIINLYGIPTLLKHGDDLCLNDKSHLLFRRISRNIFIQKLFLLLPLSWRRLLANKIRSISKSKDPKRKKEISNIPESEIVRTMSQYKVTQFIHGHTHRPMIHLFNLNEQPKTHIVLSDWGPMGNALSCQANGSMRLTYF